jgi:PAS domain S-box-containing protein
MTIHIPLTTLDARFLVVDKPPGDAALLEDTLRAAGCSQVFSTTDPTTAAAMHRQTPFDLILLDLQTTSMDSFQMMEDLKTDGSGNAVPVMVITAQPEQKLWALQAGARDFVSKPFDAAEVLTRIGNLLEMRLLHRRVAKLKLHLEHLVLERTTELRESEARYRALTELSTDWYWEQDSEGRFTSVSGPVLEMLGLQDTVDEDKTKSPEDDGWNPLERQTLQARIAARSPFLDLVLNRVLPGGETRQYRVSGTPIFDTSCTLMGYRGIGVEILCMPEA